MRNNSLYDYFLVLLLFICINVFDSVSSKVCFFFHFYFSSVSFICDPLCQYGFPYQSISYMVLCCCAVVLFVVLPARVGFYFELGSINEILPTTQETSLYLHCMFRNYITIT